MYIGAILWTVIYDTIYAFQDIDHDKKLGMNSTAIQFENHPKTILGACSAISIPLISYSAYAAGLHWSFYPIMSIAGLFQANQIMNLDIQDKAK